MYYMNIRMICTICLTTGLNILNCNQCVKTGGCKSCANSSRPCKTVDMCKITVVGHSLMKKTLP